MRANRVLGRVNRAADKTKNAPPTTGRCRSHQDLLGPTARPHLPMAQEEVRMEVPSAGAANRQNGGIGLNATTAEERGALGSPVEERSLEEVPAIQKHKVWLAALPLALDLATRP